MSVTGFTSRVRRHARPPGLRAELATAIALVTAVAVGATFLALYAGTGSRLRAQLDRQLKTQAAEWRQSTTGADLSSPRALEHAARRFLAAQRYHAEAQIIALHVNGGGTITNQPKVIIAEERRERAAPEGNGLLDAPLGFATSWAAGVGSLRVLSKPLIAHGQRVGTLRLAESLAPVDQAKSSLSRTFALVGALALVLAVAVGTGLATLIAAPLRRMTKVAAAAEQGDLSVRAGSAAGRGEVQVLAQAFDHMLDRLERGFKRQRDFVSDASHELRTPLAVLRAQVELLDRETDPARHHEGITTLLKRLDELDRLVGDMLTLASAEAGRLIEPRPINLDDYFEDLRRDLPLYGEREYQVDAVGGTLTADPDRLTQVLRNIVRNAVAHTQEGDRIMVTAHGLGDHRLEISVSDTGAGIPADQLEQIFERFHRVDHSRARDRGGSGLGLAIARAIVEAHGGTITAGSSPGHGATFRITLPGFQPDEPGTMRQPPASTVHSRAAQLTPPVGGSARAPGAVGAPRRTPGRRARTHRDR
jgi:two-component system, OmpR family, sensor kinase